MSVASRRNEAAMAHHLGFMDFATQGFNFSTPYATRITDHLSLSFLELFRLY